MSSSKSLNPNAPEFVPCNQVPSKAGDSLGQGGAPTDESAAEKPLDLQIKELISLVIFTDSPTLKKIYEIMAFVGKHKTVDAFLAQMFSVVLPLSAGEKKRSGDVIAILYFRIEDAAVKVSFQSQYKALLGSYYAECVAIIGERRDTPEREQFLLDFLELLAIYYTQTLYRDTMSVSLLLTLLRQVLLVCDCGQTRLILESLRITHRLTDLLIVDLAKLKAPSGKGGQRDPPALHEECACPADTVESLYSIIREKIVNRFFGGFSRDCLDAAIGIIEERARAFGRHHSFLLDHGAAAAPLEQC